MKSYSKDVGEYLETLSDVLSKVDLSVVEKATEAIMDAYEKNGLVYIMGNGGSASTASHIVCDFNKGISVHLDKKFKFVCLSDNTAIVMAISNDFSYEDIFLLQIEGRLNPEDILITISGSGNSKNVIKAAEYAKSKGNKVISFTGYNGGKLKEISDYPIHVDITDMQKSEDAHMILLHAIAQAVARRMGHPLC